MRYLFSIVFLLLLTNWCQAQGSAFGIKGGPSLGIQTGSGSLSGALTSYHAIAFIESLPEDDRFAIFLQGGYHNRGSSQQRRFFPGTNFNSTPSNSYIFKNLSLSLGAKQKFDWKGDNNVYYMLGVRGDYTIGNNFDQFELFSSQTNIFFFPQEFFIRKFNYGMIVGGGVELNWGELWGGVVELTINPDLSAQYQQAPIPNVYNPFTGNNESLPQRRFANVTVELTFGIRLLRKVEYY